MDREVEWAPTLRTLSRSLSVHAAAAATRACKFRLVSLGVRGKRFRLEVRG